MEDVELYGLHAVELRLEHGIEGHEVAAGIEHEAAPGEAGLRRRW